MDLKRSINQNLWEAIEKNYESESYSSAILDAMHLLTDTIRNKTGLEGDGSSLIGQAFGSENPKIKLNKLQTESEKNIQKGVQDLLRGLYTAIRNPRSHDKSSDIKEDADAIINFIGYVLKIIDASKVSFEESTFLQRVFDKYYVKDSEYSDLLVNEVPKRQRVNIGISVILKRKTGDIYNLRYFMGSLFKKLEENEILQIYKVISEELKYTDSNEDISTILALITDSHWNKLDKVVKLRIENILFEDVKLGNFNRDDTTGNWGKLGTWIYLHHLMEFENPSKWTDMIIQKLENDTEKKYAIDYFWHNICKLNYKNINYSLYNYFKNGLINDDKEVIEKLKEQIIFDENHPWWKVFENELKNYPDIKYLELPF